MADNSTEIYFVRHAQSHPSLRVPHNKWPLSTTGKRQAEDLVPLLDSLNIDRIVSSPFVRCLDTIGPFSRRSALEIAQDDNLRERYIAPNLTNDFPAIWEKSWLDFSYALPGCESSEIAQQRFVLAVRKVAKANTGLTVAISSHGNVIGLFLNHIDPSNGIAETEALRNPDVIRVIFDRKRFTWDRSFSLTGLDRIATHHSETPLDMER